MRGRDGMIPLVVREIIAESPAIVSLRLEDPTAAELPPWEAGAHIDLQLVTRHERQYSLIGDPADRHSYRIAVQRALLSRGGSHYIHTFLRPGSRVHVRPPRNLFAVAEAPAYLLLAAGIGVTPILAMARALDAAGADWRLVYAVRERVDAAFAVELAGYGERVRLHVSGEAGRLDLAAELTAVAPGTDVYACGPAGFADALVALRERLPEGSTLHMERFEPKRMPTRPDEAFTVVAAASGVVVEVARDQTMLHALQGAGIPVAGSCLRGVCGSCALRLVDGTPEHRDSLTDPEERGTIYPCVSRSISPQLVVDA